MLRRVFLIGMFRLVRRRPAHASRARPVALTWGTTPAAMAGRIAEHFAVGDSVKMMCRGSELAYLEKV